MRFFRRKSDPLSRRERALERELKDLQQQIANLDHKNQNDQNDHKVQNDHHQIHNQVHHNDQNDHHQIHHKVRNDLPSQNPFSKKGELVFEPLNKDISKPETLDVRVAHYNELGVKKLDLVWLWDRVSSYFKKSPASQSKFVNYLAAGSIQGVRSLRYERRIARNRFLVMFGLFLMVLFGILAILQKQL